MKKIFKLVAVLAALTVAGFGFVACSDDDDEESVVFDLRKQISGDVVARYVGSHTEKDDDGVEEVITQTVTFYTADSQKLFQVDEKEAAGGQAAYLTFLEGTYDGDPTTDGTVTLSATKAYEPNHDRTDLTSRTAGYSLTATISGTKATIVFDEDDDDTLEFTRQ